MQVFITRTQELNNQTRTPTKHHTLTFIIKAVDAVDAGTLMVAPEKEEVFWVLDFVGQQQADGLQRLLPSVNVIAQEEVIGLRRKSAIFKQS